MRGLSYGTLLWVCALAARLAFPQTDARPVGRPGAAFEAVSIHAVDAHAASSGDGLFSMSSFPTNLFYLRGAPLAFLVQFAYGVDSQDHISAMPGWMESQEFDVSAKVEGEQQLTLEEMRPMLQRLLEERFHFAAHHETKVMSGFALVVARGGAKLQASKEGEKPFAQILPGRIEGGGMKMRDIASVLAHRADEPAVDKTGLAGSYDFRVSFAPANDANSSLPDFFTALQEQLGLKLQASRVPVEFLVVDRVDRVPTEN